MKFELETAAPDHTKIPPKDLIGVTAILLTCSYNNQEFFRVGYYVNVTFDNEEMNLNPPENIDINNVVKNILHDKPRITKFNIDWDCAVTAIPSFTNFTNDNQSEFENNKNFINENSNHMNNLNYRMGGNNYFDTNQQNTNFMFSNNNTINNQGTVANQNFSN
jgi:histone chaperone ASF1